MVIGFTGFVADYVMNVGLSHLLATHEYGDFKVAWTFTILFGAFVLLGGDRACPKALAGPLERGETAHAWEYVRFYMLVGVTPSVLVIALTTLGVGSALNVALIPKYGMLGAAASTAATLTLGGVALALCRSRSRGRSTAAE